MDDRPEWMSSSLLKMNQKEKKCVLAFCRSLNIQCTCSHVTMCGLKEIYCTLCFRLLKDPQTIVINENECISVENVVKLSQSKKIGFSGW